MVVTTIFAYFLNNIFSYAYFFLKIGILYLYNTFKIIQFSILLSDLQAFISNIIFKGKRSFNSPSIPSRVDFHSFSLILPPPPPPSPPQFTHNHTQQLGSESLPSIEGCGPDQSPHCSLTSEDAVAAAPPLFQGMWAAYHRSTEEWGMEKT
jgi:hypothetical protein